MVYRESTKPCKLNGSFKLLRIKERVILNYNSSEVHDSIMQVKLVIKVHCRIECLILGSIVAISSGNTKLCIWSLRHHWTQRNICWLCSGKKEKVEGLLKRNNWRIIKKINHSQNVNVHNRRSVISAKNKDSEHKLFKARFIVEEPKYKEKKYVLNYSSKMQQSTMKTTFPTAVTVSIEIWSQDFQQYTLNSTKNLFQKYSKCL